MFPSALLPALAGTLLLTVADNVPTLNVEAGCRAAAKMGDSFELGCNASAMPGGREQRARPVGKPMDAVPAGAAAALPCHHRDRRRPQLRRSSRLPPDGARRGADGGPLGGRSARQEMTQIMHVFVI